jgi:periplasmic protein TonB
MLRPGRCCKTLSALLSNHPHSLEIPDTHKVDAFQSTCTSDSAQERLAAALHLGPMRRWPLITTLTLSVLAVHGAGLWALHVYQSQAAPQPSPWHARVLPSPSGAQANVASKQTASGETATAPEATSPTTTKPVVTARITPVTPGLPQPSQQAIATSAPTQAAPQAQSPAATSKTVKTTKTINSDALANTKTDIAAATSTSDAPQPVAAGKPINPTTRADQPANNSAALAKDTPEKTIQIQARLDADHADTQYRHPYPALSKKLAEEGTVVLRVVVDAQGKPVSAAIAQSSGYARLDDAGQQTVMRWRFKPATVNGVPEAQSTVLQSVKFRLSTEASSP